MWNNVSMPTSHAAGRNRYLFPVFASTQVSGRRTSFHIEICMGIDELKSHIYVRTKIRPI